MRDWEWLEGVKSQSPSEVAIAELGKLLAEELGNWPPQVEWDSEEQRRPYEKLLAPGSATPSATVFVEALKLARWELEREDEALNQYLRNHHLERACPLQSEQQAATFLQLYFVEAFYELIERTENRVKRREIIAGWDTLQRRILAVAQKI